MAVEMGTATIVVLLSTVLVTGLGNDECIPTVTECVVTSHTLSFILTGCIEIAKELFIIRREYLIDLRPVTLP